MHKTILQIPMSKSLQEQAKTVALDYGFSSLQEAVRVVLNKLAKRQLTITIEEDVEYLTPRQDRVLKERYQQFINDKKRHKTYQARSVDEMLKQLSS